MSTAQLSLRELFDPLTSLGRMRQKRGIGKHLEDLWVECVVKGNDPSSVPTVRVLPEKRGSVVVYPGDPEEKVMIWWKHEPSEALAQMEKGPKVLGVWQVKPTGSVDVQSGPLERWQPAIEQADEAIRFAYDNQEPHEALKTISSVWEHLDNASELAAARSRLLMGKVAEPLLAETPEWFEEQVRSLHPEEEGEIPANPLAIESARLLVRAALASTDQTDDLKAGVDLGPLGRVAIDWQIPGLRLHWMVEATDLPWPSVKVYQVFRPTGRGEVGTARTQIFHNAFDVVDSFADLLRAR